MATSAPAVPISTLTSSPTVVDSGAPTSAPTDFLAKVTTNSPTAAFEIVKFDNYYLRNASIVIFSIFLTVFLLFLFYCCCCVIGGKKKQKKKSRVAEIFPRPST